MSKERVRTYVARIGGKRIQSQGDDNWSVFDAEGERVGQLSGHEVKIAYPNIMRIHLGYEDSDSTECSGFCGGTGVHRYGGGTINGKFVGSSGVCFRCVGKGYENEADRKRNYGYDNFYRKAYC